MRHKDLCLQIFLLLSSFSYSIAGDYTSIFSFGDSYTDTGNLLLISGPVTQALLLAQPPYGTTFFRHPTGRLSDGRLIIDFIAEALGLPLLPPSFAVNRSFDQGANFATAGATALNRAFFEANNFTGMLSPYNISLSDQLRWFDGLKPSLCGGKRLQGCEDYFSNALFFVGELGWNDYAAVLLAGRGVDEARSHTPEVVRMICAATQKLIDEGVKTVVVSGISPMGCSSGNLELFTSANEADYEPDTGCLKNLNLLSREHNHRLRQALAQLSGSNPDTRIIYGDFYTPIIELAATPCRFGIDGRDGALRACCGGGGGQYNFNLKALCGMAGVSSCEDPSMYVNWDGIHLTEATYHRVADGWLRGPYARAPTAHTEHAFIGFGISRF